MRNYAAGSTRLSILTLAVVLPLAVYAFAAGGLWRDKGDRFSIQLLKNWKLEEEKVVMEPDAVRKKVLEAEPGADLSVFTDADLSVVQFKFTNNKEKASIYMVFSPKTAGMGHHEMFREVVDSLPSSGLGEVSPVGDVADLFVNEHPARWGVYKGIIQGTTIPLYCYIGAVSLDEGAVNFMAMLSEGKRKTLAPDLEAMFQSVK